MDSRQKIKSQMMSKITLSREIVFFDVLLKNLKVDFEISFSLELWKLKKGTVRKKIGKKFPGQKRVVRYDIRNWQQMQVLNV